MYHLFREHIGWLEETEGPSMLPTLRSQGDWVVHDRISHRLTARTSLTRGTLVIYNAPYDRTRVVCKRLIGLPGDIICVDPYPDPPLDGDGEQIEDDVMRREGAIESDVISRLVEPNSPRHIVVPEGHFWAQGDNRPWTRDSNNYGPVPFGLLRGQARAIISFSPFGIRKIPTNITDIES